MASSDSRQAMMDENLVYWSSQLRDTIQSLNPGALVTVGFFEPQGPNPTLFGMSSFHSTVSRHRIVTR